MTWFVEIVEYESGQVVHSIECASERSAGQVERGVIINLNDKFYTRIVHRKGDTHHD